ncbi:glycosyltransferase [Lacisediminihabitans changchengi]|uniref:4,4'-diaponeurosporenoate glycosyltransferase n=1 Tax=Lacisediminihabitans changchengi TaxID=2787634 RepID=A0A934SU18_9MICO|nr:glycosyltransferase family A protein [Lacisediminihabitans changchengi]MBK4348968.1 glycosyltransferase family 2 protein [Lacisediminihabitans changchengi]
MTRLAVVIPARDEGEFVERCLRSVLAARDATARDIPIVLVADSCGDATAVLARSMQGVTVIELDAANVGAARAAGVTRALELLDAAPEQCWIANTDADSVVPRNWIVEQLAIAEEGFDLMIGTVRPDFADLSTDQIAHWRRTHRRGSPNGHVHGANLGVRASAYLRAGGFASLSEHEDNDLVGRITGRALPTDGCEVLTSGRSIGRTPGGYARFLHGGIVA